MSNLELIKAHEEGTKFCSFIHHMESASPTYKKIIKKGKDILPDVLMYMRDNKDSGMSIILLLCQITKITPYQPKQIKNTTFAEYDVQDCRKAWIKWGKTQKLI